MNLTIPILSSVPLGPINLQVWGLFVGLGVFVAYILAQKRFKAKGIDPKHMEKLFLWSVVLAFVGARLLFVLIEYDFYLSHPIDILKFWQGGLAFTGGFLLVLAYLILYIRKNNLNPWKVTDGLVVPLVAGLAIGRFGCLFTGLHPGILTDIGAVFNVDGDLRAAWPFYAIINWFIAWAFLVWLEKKPFKKGLLTQVMLLWWGLWRFGADFIRADVSVFGGDPRYGLLTPTQYLALGVICLSLYLIYNSRKNMSEISSTVKT